MCYNPPMNRMLIVEDDDNLSRGITFVFEKEGYDVVCSGTLESAGRAVEQREFDIVILDLNLPDGDGVAFCRMLREASNVPVIMLTARDLETDEVQGLMAGADDYVIKPFSLSVLRARVESVLRRREKSDGHILRAAGYKLDTQLCKLYREDTEIPISATEFRLLNCFMRSAGQILTKEQILGMLWDNRGNYVDENTLSVNISRLRVKIGDNPRNPRIIKNIRGMGYIWVKE